MMNRRLFPSKFIAYLILLAITAGCSEQLSGPRAWIDFPLSGSGVSVGKPVSVLAHAYSPEGIAELMLLVNGVAYRRNPPSAPGNVFTDGLLEWLPQQAGEYLLQVTAFSKSGTVINTQPVSVRAIGHGTSTPVARTPIVITPIAITPVARASDLAIVSVESVVAGYKGTTPICNIRVVYKNAGPMPVPSDYIIQASLDGRPHASMTRGAGFGAGGLSEAVFVYQFIGSAYIGINLDSTNAITESNEMNNAFAEIRACGDAAPPPTVTVPMPLPPTGCAGAPVISSFYAYPQSITQGQTATLTWGAVTNADSVTIEPGIGSVSTPGSRGVSPRTTTTYIMTARCGNNTVTRQTTVTALPLPSFITPTFTPTRTRSPIPRDTTPPPIPNPVDPTGGESVSCSGATGSATLKWSSVSDPSGVQYYVKWNGAGQSGGWNGTGTQRTISVKCGYQYTWQVRACDLEGNCSNWSANVNFLSGTIK